MKSAGLKVARLYAASPTILAAILLCILAAFVGTASGVRQSPAQDKDRSKSQKTEEMSFHAAQLVSAGDVFIPYLSVANGLTVLSVSIGKDGRVTDTEVVLKLPSATESSISAVKKWEFLPAKLDGMPIESRVTVGVVFCWNKGKIKLPPIEHAG
jgi:hypothetical protein